ncbi:MAG: hypothetical protein KF850_13060 [Labilithrix sp.]|nr:hypothetical protein [Labilithrix sp.]MBX3212960.1 hypothetical protein [Labilithrix sp.]
MSIPPPKKKAMPWWAILLIAFGALAFLGLLAIGGVVWWVSANKDRLIAVGREGSREAEAFARDHDQSECVDEGIRKVASCDGVLCEAQMKIFTTTCIRDARRTPGFCDDVPRMHDIVNTSRWVLDECSRRGKPNNSRCTRLVQAVPEACHPPVATEEPDEEE